MANVKFIRVDPNSQHGCQYKIFPGAEVQRARARLSRCGSENPALRRHE